MRVDDLDFHLPEGLIATSAAEPRDSARLLVVSCSDPSRLEHRAVRDLPGLLRPGDLMISNDSKVVPARFVGRNLDTGGGIEGLWLRDELAPEGRPVWVAMIKARRHRAGRVFEVFDPSGEPTPVRLRLLGPADDEPGAWRLEAWDETDPAAGSMALLERVGRAPLPPYIRNARRHAGEADERANDMDRYQTIFSAGGESGSVAAPTAGLHFTPGLLERLDAAGVRRATVTLHVGTGTFKPVEVDDLDDHPMHAEWCAIPGPARDALAAAERVVAVGTTSARTLEAFAALEGPWPERLNTDLLIQPGYAWRRVDALMTNFHLPRSTLLAMVAALFPGGVERVKQIYAEAIRERYRFYSFGDAMLILP